MQIVIRSAEGQRELTITLRNPDATLTDVVHASGCRAGRFISVNGRAVPASSAVSASGLHDGAVLDVTGRTDTRIDHAARTTPSPRAGQRTSDLPHLAIVAGPSAGTTFPLRAGRSSIGRHSSNAISLPHPTVSRGHCEITLDASGPAEVVDVGAANPTIVDGYQIPPGKPVELGPRSVVEVGAFALAVRTTDPHDRPRGGDAAEQVSAAGTIAFNRPPRLAPALPADPIEVPAAPTEASRPDFNITMVAGPLVLAGALIVITGNFQFAMFALLSPVIAVGMWYEGGRRATRKNDAAQAEYRSALQHLHEQVRTANAVAAERLWTRCPDPAETLRRAAAPSVRLWERRSQHEDFLAVFLGIGDLPWQPRLPNGSGPLPTPTAQRPEATTLRSAPVTAELAKGGVVGIVGSRSDAVALARSLVCQAAVHQGPADLTIGVFVDEGRGPDWSWSKWLPHTRDPSGPSGRRWLGQGRAECDAQLGALRNGGGAPSVLLVLDSDTLTDGKDAPARTLLHNVRPPGSSAIAHVPRFSGIVIASSADRLPSMCTTIVDVRAYGTATVWFPDERRELTEVLIAGMDVGSSLVCARSIARFEDPELHLLGETLPELVRLLPLLGLPSVNAESIRKNWRRGTSAGHPTAALGVTEKGVFTLDLVEHGPHGLVGGTTGSGKSELLRSLVAALAAGSDPRQLTFVLIDYKGGAAFDECARLPHTVGMVTDLDAQLSERALIALNAELHHRERQLRAAGADNITAYQELGAAQPMPRLVVVVDEFATLAKELPEFMTSLVGVAQRGRSLGVHMILATQRPSGAVNDDIRANTGLKIALRVQDPADSSDVIGVRDAADINRAHKGRAYARLGPGELIPIQTALITCVSEEGADIPVEVSPFVFGPVQPGSAPPLTNTTPGQATGRTDLVRLVDAIVEATELEGIPPARKPWPEPLPPRIALSELIGGSIGGPAPTAVVARADDPRTQRQYPIGWEVSQGNLALVGINGSGTTTTMAAIALALASVARPEELEIQAFDFGAGELVALERLPHTGAVVPSGDRERQMRLMRYVVAELGRRRLAGPGAERRRLLVLVDNVAALRAQFTDVDGSDLFDRFARVVADGAGVGISFVASGDKPSAFGGALAMPQQWLFRLTDAYDYVAAGVSRTNLPARVPGRAVVAHTGLHIQVGCPAPDIPTAVNAVLAGHQGARQLADAIGVLPDEVAMSAVRDSVDVGGDLWNIPIGIAEADLTPAGLQLYEGEHALVVGPARSGKSTVLWTIAELLRGGSAPVHLAGMGGRRSPLRDCSALDRYAARPGESTAMLAQLRTVSGPVVLLIDDAESFDDADAAISTLLTAEIPTLHVIAAGHNDQLRKLYGHWTKTVGRSKTGLLLKPNIDMDGDVLGAILPRRSPVSLAVSGRGYLVVNGEARIVQAARA